MIPGKNLEWTFPDYRGTCGFIPVIKLRRASLTRSGKILKDHVVPKLSWEIPTRSCKVFHKKVLEDYVCLVLWALIRNFPARSNLELGHIYRFVEPFQALQAAWDQRVSFGIGSYRENPFLDFLIYTSYPWKYILL